MPPLRGSSRGATAIVRFAFETGATSIVPVTYPILSRGATAVDSLGF